MSTSTVPQRNPKRISVWMFLLIVVAYTGILVSAGWFVGKQFFWINPEIAQAKKELSHYSALVDKNPNDVDSRIALAYRLYVLGDYKESITHLQAVLKLDKKYYDAYLNLGYVYFAMEEYDKALKNFVKCTEIVPNDHKGWMNAGIASYKLKNYEKALDYLGNAKVTNRGSADVLYHTAVTLELMGDKQGAIQEYENALSFDPDYEEAKEGLKKLTRG